MSIVDTTSCDHQRETVVCEGEEVLLGLADDESEFLPLWLPEGTESSAVGSCSNLLQWRKKLLRFLRYFLFITSL